LEALAGNVRFARKDLLQTVRATHRTAERGLDRPAVQKPTF
jgi:hypothetical protein